MLRFLLARSGQGILVLWGIVTLLFLIFYALGDPTDYVVGDQADMATRQAIREKYGLDAPLPVQYVRYLGGFARLDLGRSFQSNKPVGELLGSHLQGTAILALAAILLAALLGISLGVVAALKRDTWADRTILAGSLLGVSAPSFFVAAVLAWLFAVVLRPWTGLNITGYFFEEEIFGEGRHIVWANLVLPALALGLRPLAVFVQLTRSSLLEVLSADYIRTARAKGASPVRVIVHHALRNALNPVLTSVTGWLASLLAGAFFVEYMFNWQGLGKLAIDALHGNDFPVILGCAATIGGIFVGINIATDLLYAVLDKRTIRQ